MRDLESSTTASDNREPRSHEDVPGFLGLAIDLLASIGRHRRSIVLAPFVAALLAAGVSFALPRRYTAVTRILPPQAAQSMAAALLSQVSGALPGLATATLPKNPNDLYVAMLKSDTVADALAARFNLKEVYEKKLNVDVRRALRSDSRIVSDRAGFIAIEFEARDPRFAADVANAYVEELHRLTSTLAVTEAAQRRLFFERQLKQTKDHLADAEVQLREALDSGGLVSVDAQGRLTVETGARLRAQITAKEVQIGAMRAYATPNNPEMMRAEQEILSLRRQLTRVESGDPEERAAPPVRGVGNIRLLREVKYNEVLFELLARQYELARADESKESPVVQVLDRAVPPERKSKPQRLVLVLGAFIAVLVIAVAHAVARDALDSTARDPAQRRRLENLRAAWGGRRAATADSDGGING